MDLKKKFSSQFYYYQWLFSTRKERKLFPKLKILSHKRTIQEIVAHKKSMSRFGDGEFRLLFPEFHLEFQSNNEEIRKRLKEVLTSHSKNHLVCLPEPFAKVSQLELTTKYWWKKFINNFGNRISPFLDPAKTYGNSFITRFYIGYKDKSEATITQTVSLLKQIWDKQDILIIEGKYSRLGIGNNLFDNVNSLRRIITLDKNAFSLYNEILDAAKKHGRNRLILIALGPTATILSHDLAKEQYWALDVGHIDIEYMWFLIKAKDKVAIEGRHVNEAEDQKSLDLPENYKKEYHESIILEIK